MASKKATPQSRSQRAGGGARVVLRSIDEECEVSTKELRRIAMQWSYIVRNRHRWQDSRDEIDRLSHSALGDLDRLGVGPKKLEKLAACSLVEVGVDFGGSDADSWPGRIFPWEFVISRATRLLAERHRDFLVVRHLETGRKRSSPRVPKRMLFVASSPGRFRSQYVFDDERELLERALRDAGASFEQSRDPTRAQLARLALQFDAIHLSGIDAHLGAELRGDGSLSNNDGFYLRDDKGQEDLVEAGEFAELLAKDGRGPKLVTFNAYNSAARLASRAVGAGCGAAIGFQDRFDDAQTELFFVVFYREWARHGSLLAAFRKAFAAMRTLKNVSIGSGIVLWSAQSLLSEATPTEPKSPRARPKPKPSEPELKLLQKLPDSLNYPKLHNNENLFEYLRIYNYGTNDVDDVLLEIVLQVGAESYGYRQRLNLVGPVTSLEHKVRIALSWNLMRNLTESVQTTVLIRASYRDKPFHEETLPVELLPVNEWLDDRDSGPWLPSLVLPRDPIVAEIIDRARRYLRVLADDANVGFDGYQRVPITDAEPDEDQVWIVDVQVRAIWYALMHDYELGYINPPPTFTAESQRLRRPSEVIKGRHGTCIDLALLLAACMEYIGINPVLFLIDGHAFPGYWRSDRTLLRVEPSSVLERSDIYGMRPSAYPWSSGAQYWKELDQRVRHGHIVPIEAVDLTSASSFDLALDHGRENLRNPNEFNTMLDIVKARSHRVTPLPL